MDNEKKTQAELEDEMAEKALQSFLGMSEKSDDAENEKYEEAEEVEEAEDPEESYDSDDTDALAKEYEDYEEEYEAKPMKLGKFEILICALAVFAPALWTLSAYGTAMMCGLALLLTVLTKPGKDAVHCVVANALTLGTMIFIRITLNISAIIFELIMNASEPKKTLYGSAYNDWEETITSFNDVMSVINSVLHLLVFVVFIINVFCLISKKRTPIFGKTAAKLSDKEEE